jgi:hypothetical protein
LKNPRTNQLKSAILGYFQQVSLMQKGTNVSLNFEKICGSFAPKKKRNKEGKT